MHKRLFWMIAATVALACSSCGNSIKLYPVTGKVMYKGAPAVGATVFLQRQGVDPINEHTIMGIAREDGSFTLVCGPHGQGAPEGEYDVFIEWRHHSDRTKGLAHKGTDRLKGRFADRKHPRLHVVVNAGPNNLPAYDLADAEPVQKRRDSP